MIVTIRDDELTIEDYPEMPGDASGLLSLMHALLWAVMRISESAEQAANAAKPTVH